MRALPMHRSLTQVLLAMVLLGSVLTGWVVMASMHLDHGPHTRAMTTSASDSATMHTVGPESEATTPSHIAAARGATTHCTLPPAVTAGPQPALRPVALQAGCVVLVPVRLALPPVGARAPVGTLRPPSLHVLSILRV